MKENTSTVKTTPTLTTIDGKIKELRWKSALFEITFCKCFQASCTCTPIEIWLPKSECEISNGLWETGTATVKLPVWLLTKETRNLGLR